MGSTALQILNVAYRAHNLDELASFATTQEFPYSIGLDTINEAVRAINRLGSLWFSETKTALPYTAGVNTYTLTTLGIDPKRIRFVRTESATEGGELKQVHYRQFLKLYRASAVQTAKPVAYAKYADTLELNSIPDADYGLYCYHFKDLPVVSATTDTFSIPERDEDILSESCYQILGYRLGRWTLADAVGGIGVKVQPFLADMKKERGLVYQRPAAF